MIILTLLKANLYQYTLIILMNYHRNFLMHRNLKWHSPLPIIVQMFEMSHSQQSHQSGQSAGGSLVDESKGASLLQLKSFALSNSQSLMKQGQVQQRGNQFQSIVLSIEGKPELKAKLLLKQAKINADNLKEKVKLSKISHEREKTQLRIQTVKLLRTMNLEKYSLEQVGRFISSDQNEPIIKTIEVHQQNQSSPVPESPHSEKKEKQIKKKPKKYMKDNQHIIIQRQLTSGMSIRNAAIQYGLSERQIRNIKKKNIKVPSNPDSS